MNEANIKIGLRIADLLMWMKVLNCLMSNFNVEKKYSVDAGLPVTEASFQDCMERFIEITKELANEVI